MLKPKVVHFLLFLSALIILAWVTRTVRFIVPALNYIFLGIGLLIPIIYSIIFKIRKPDHIGLTFRIFAYITGIAALPFFLLWLFIFGLMHNELLFENMDPSFEYIFSHKIDGTIHRVYRTNGGATTAFGIVVRKEYMILPGLYFVKVDQSKYRAENAKVIKEQNGHEFIHIESY